MKKTIINFCPTGMVPMKQMTPHVPVSAQEIIEQTHEAYEIGITIVHLHARNHDESPTWLGTVYRQIFDGVRKYCPDLVICGSTSGRQWSDFEKRAEVIMLRPDMCSLTLSSMNFMHQASINAPDMVIRLASTMAEYGVIPELECFDLGMINYGHYLIRKGILTGPFYWNLLFGNIAGFQATLPHIAAAVSSIPESHFIGMAGLGSDQIKVHGTTIAMGYGVRVGIEDNIWLDQNRTQKATNSDLIHKVHQLIQLHERVYMTGREFKNLGFTNQTTHAKD